MVIVLYLCEQSVVYHTLVYRELNLKKLKKKFKSLEKCPCWQTDGPCPQQKNIEHGQGERDVIFDLQHFELLQFLVIASELLLRFMKNNPNNHLT